MTSNKETKLYIYIYIYIYITLNVLFSHDRWKNTSYVIYVRQGYRRRMKDFFFFFINLFSRFFFVAFFKRISMLGY